MLDLRFKFESVDKNGDGTLTREEIREIVAVEAPEGEKEELELVLNKVDSDKNNKVSYSEFINLTQEMKKLITK